MRGISHCTYCLYITTEKNQEESRIQLLVEEKETVEGIQSLINFHKGDRHAFRAAALAPKYLFDGAATEGYLYAFDIFDF